MELKKVIDGNVNGYTPTIEEFALVVSWRAFRNENFWNNNDVQEILNDGGFSDIATDLFLDLVKESVHQIAKKTKELEQSIQATNSATLTNIQELKGEISLIKQQDTFSPTFQRLPHFYPMRFSGRGFPTRPFPSSFFSRTR